MTQSLRRFFFFSSLFLLIPLTACQTTIANYRDCKTGDWQLIGGKDGEQGFDPRFEERRKFCAIVDSDNIKTESASAYQSGWQQGNNRFWYNLGRNDGKTPQPVTYFDSQAQSARIKENKTPLNPLEYQRGWRDGNRDYWVHIGDADGFAGRPDSDQQTRANTGQMIGFNRDGYLEGWRGGNQAYWTKLGFQDAHDGIPDAALKTRANDAKNMGVLVREDAYHNAWNTEIIEYWKRLAWDDAMTGRDVNTRRIDAKNRGLKFSEADYKQRWEERVILYWQDVGGQDGFGQPNLLESRMANARRDNVFIIRQTRDVYNQAWAAQNQRYCSADNAFDFGRKNSRFAFEVCLGAQQNQARRAWDGGREFEFVLAKQSQNQFEINQLLNRRADLARRLANVPDIKAAPDTKDRRNNPNASAPATADNTDKEKQAERERQADRQRRELREQIDRVNYQIGELRRWDFTFDSQLRQIKRDVLRQP